MRVLSSVIAVPAIVISYGLATSSTTRVLDVEALKLRANRRTDGLEANSAIAFLKILNPIQRKSEPTYHKLRVLPGNDLDASEADQPDATKVDEDQPDASEVDEDEADDDRPKILSNTQIRKFGNIHRLEYSDGSVYEGQVRDGKRHGQGTFKQFGEKYLEKGMWQKDVAKSYEGMWKNDMRHGQGVLKIFSKGTHIFSRSGHTVKGTWDNGQLNGNGSETKVCKLKYGFGSTTLPRDIMPEVKGGHLRSGYSVKIEGVCEEKPSLASEKPNTGILVKNGTLTYGTGVSTRDRVTVKLTADLQLLDAGWDLKLNV